MQEFGLKTERGAYQWNPTVNAYRDFSNTSYAKKIISIFIFTQFSGKGRQSLINVHYETSQNANFLR